MVEFTEEQLGHATLEPSGPVVAGSVGQWTVTYTVGSLGIDEGGTLKIARRFASDEARPQFDDPAGESYCSVRTDGEAELAARYDPKGHVRPWMKCVVIDVYDGCLAPGDTVTVTFGDRSGGSPGVRAQTFIESAHEVRVLVDPTNACLVRRVPSSPAHPIVAGDPVVAVPIVPTRAQVDTAVEVFLKGEDTWGNPTPPPDAAVLRWEGDGGVTLEGRTLRASAPGSGRVVAAFADRELTSNPITFAAQPPEHGRWWADLHAQSDATVGTGTEREYFTFGRHWAHLDVMSHQGNDFQVTEEDWARLEAAVAEAHEDGRFVVFPGFEWSANTPAGGDRNVIYRREGKPILRSSHWQVPGVPSDERTPAHPADDLYRRLRAHVDPAEVLVAAHCGGRYADIRRYFDPQLEKLVEVASCWGVFEWLLWDAFELGYRVGVMCNSDGHKGRPGAEGPGAGQFGIYGGLTCILAESLTRDAVFAALMQRRCYGTTGPRMDLDFTVDGAPMGSDLPAASQVHVEASLRGAGAVEALMLYRGREPIAVARPPSFDGLERSRRLRLMWGGARIRGRGRRAIWDGTIRFEGARLVDAKTVAFDSPADGIEGRDDHSLHFRSRTTGDDDGLDLWLEDASAGRLFFETEVGRLELDLATLGSTTVTHDLGGLDLHVDIGRYPEQPADLSVTLSQDVALPAGETSPLWVKAVQVDGHLAWASPVYVG